MTRISFGNASISSKNFIVSIMFNHKRKYDYNFINDKITDLNGNIISNKVDEEDIRKQFKSPDFERLKDLFLEKKDDYELTH